MEFGFSNKLAAVDKKWDQLKGLHQTLFHDIFYLPIAGIDRAIFSPWMAWTG